jgi:molybdate transport system substrate-binding protein
MRTGCIDMNPFLLPILAISFMLAASAAPAAQVTVFAAVSLSDSLKEIAAVYEKQTGDKIILNFGASSTLARQIEEGAPADIFFSADEAKMDGLEKKGLIVKETRRSRLSNLLVIVTTSDSSLAIASPKALASPSVKRLALGDPKAVPAGLYAREYLTKLGLWSAVEKKVVPCENVRAVLAAVESGNVDAGFVYKTDAAISRKVRIVLEVAAQDGPQISYPLALVKDARQPAAAKKLLDYLAGPEAGKVFARRGFILLPAEGKK